MDPETNAVIAAESVSEKDEDLTHRRVDISPSAFNCRRSTRLISRPRLSNGNIDISHKSLTFSSPQDQLTPVGTSENKRKESEIATLFSLTSALLALVYLTYTETHLL